MECDVIEFGRRECMRRMVNYVEVCIEVRKNEEGKFYIGFNVYRYCWGL